MTDGKVTLIIEADDKGAIKKIKAVGDESDKSADDMEELGDSAEKSSDSFGVVDVAIGNLISNGLSALISSIGNAVSSLAALADETREYREDMAKLDTAFETAGHSTETAGQAYEDFYAILGESDRAVEAVNHLAELTKNEQEVAKWSDICAGVTAKFGDSLPIEGLTEAANETAKVSKVTGPLADALNWAGISEDEFNEKLAECTSEQKRATLITDTLNKEYAEAADEYNKLTKETQNARKATAKMEEAQADLGDALEPVTTSVTEMKTEFLRGLTPVLKEDVLPVVEDFISDMKESGTIGKFTDEISGLAKTVLPILGEALKFVAENFDVLLAVVLTAVTAFKTFQAVTAIQGTISAVSTAISGLAAGTSAMTVAQTGLNAAMAANPIGAVITAVVLLTTCIAGLVSAYNNAKGANDYYAESLERNAEANAKWQETMNNATTALGDYSNFANAAGNTSSDLAAKMDEAQANITAIYATAFEEQRGLRKEELAKIKEYNDRYIELQNELTLLEQQKLKAQADALQWKLENMDLTAEEEQGILNKLSEIRANYNETLAGAVADELVILEQRRSNGQISEEQYQIQKEAALAKQSEYAETEKSIMQGVTDAALEAQQKRFEINTADFTDTEHHFQSMEEIASYYNSLMKKIKEDETLSWWDRTMALKKANNEAALDFAKFASGMEVTWNDYSYLTDTEIQKNSQAFFNWVGNTKAAGKELTDENKKTAAAILSAYEDLPEDLEEQGLKSLRAFAKGMSDEYPELENAAEMNMEELLAAMNSSLGVNSPSTKTAEMGGYVMEGLGSGMNKKLPDLRSIVSSIGESIMKAWKSIFDIQSPSKRAEKEIGVMIPRGVGVGMEKEIPDIEKQMVGDISGITARVQATVSAESAKMGQGIGNRDSGIYDLTRAVGMQTAGINSLAGEYRRGVGNMRPVILKLDKRELGKAVVDVGTTEGARVGLKLETGGA